MTDVSRADRASDTPSPDALHGDADWQPLPPRAARLAALSAGVSSLIPVAIFAVTSHLGDPIDPRLRTGLLVLAIVLPCLVAALSWRRTRRTCWRLDDNALGVRRLRLWESDVRVPRARVQHLDIQRGPLQRRAGLATLTVHTAGSQHHALRLVGLELADAEWLRELLARPQDHDGL